MTCGTFQLSVMLGLLFIMLTGCGQQNPVTEQAPPAIKMKVPSKSNSQDEKTMAEEKTASAPEYVYEPAGLRDPFEALLMIKKPVVDSGEPLTPLQKFDLSQFRLSAVVVGKNEPTAMVVAPGGKAYVIKPGVKIGKNGGVVSRISSEMIYVEERYYDFTGKLSTTNLEIGFTQKAGDN